ncbi:MAG TPA: ABC transporter ATP-binding protein [Thermohalobaculum sp.]|nr:ABC transporter ATP-binding protein [Thermohalobaculum sp.]
MSGPPVMALDSVTKRFGTVTAVDSVSLELKEGEFFALLGPSGCGKTTLLRILAGFEAPDTGRVMLDGAEITRLRANRRPVNLMFQSYALFPHMTVSGNIAYGLEMERLPRSEIDRRTAEIMDLAELTELAGRRPDQLSGGQRQRVALARALVKRPRVLLLDEPLAALDKKLREQMQIELKRLQHDLGLTFVVVTHDQEEALVMADRLALMEAGRVVQTGGPRDLYENPASRFVAGFIGVTNFFEGTTADGGLATEAHGLLRADATATPGKAATIAVRPERITLAAAATEGLNGARGLIAAVAYHGNDLNIHVAVPGTPRAVVARVDATSEIADRFQPGQTVCCTWRPEHGRLLTE